MVSIFTSDSNPDQFQIWEYKFAFLPKTCTLTHKTIWFMYAYRCRTYFRTGDITFDFEEKWHRKNEHLVWILRN